MVSNLLPSLEGGQEKMIFNSIWETLKIALMCLGVWKGYELGKQFVIIWDLYKNYKTKDLKVKEIINN